MIKEDYDYTKIFNIAKIFAILSVILAHSKIQNGNVISAFAERMGCIGVVVFYFISGYFFNISKYGKRLFFKKKIKTILIPWLFLGSLLFLLSPINKNFLNWFNWMIGNGSYLYYLTILMMCFILFSFSQKKNIIIICILLTIVSVFCTANSLSYFPLKNLNPYLNPLNWIGFFALGLLLKTNTISFFKFIFNFRIIIIFSFLFLLYLSSLLENNSGYFSSYAIIIETFGIAACFSLSTFRIFSCNLLQKISGYTFSIYLIHFLIFPLRKILFINQYTQFINPIIYLCVAYFLLRVGQYIASKINLKNLYNTLLGLR